MLDMRPVSSDEFQAFLANYPNSLETRIVGQLRAHMDNSLGAWPDNLVASFMPASATRRRDGGWRVAILEAVNAQG